MIGAPVRVSAALAAAIGLLAGCSEPTPPPPTARIDRGDVVSSVQAAGSVTAVSEVKLTMPAGGKITGLRVKVGDRVAKGQLLAGVDDFALRQTLAQKEATLAEQRAALGKAGDSNAVPAAEAALSQAEEIEEATREQGDVTESAAEVATGRARSKLDVESSARDLAADQLRAARAACSGAATCDVSSAEAAVSRADSSVASARSGLSAAQEKERTDAADSRVAAARAGEGVVKARNDLDAARSDRPFDLADLRAKVAEAESAVTVARHDVAQTMLIAPSAGVIDSINGTVGEFLPSSASAVTPQGPGGSAPIPEAATAGVGDAGSGAARAPGAGAFIVLSSTDAFEAVVPFEESDAVKLAPGQPADIVLDAFPDRTLTGQVLAIAPTGTQLGGIVSFYTTVSLDGDTASLRTGQTADVSVHTEVARNVLRVPSAAVERSGGRTGVTVTGANGDPQRVEFEPGLVGDRFVEVRSGLSAGTDVRLPQATVTTAPGQPRGRLRQR